MLYPGIVTEVRDCVLPEAAMPAGYAALAVAFNLNCDKPYKLTAIASRHKHVDRDGWRLLTPRHRPAATLEGHLTFALKYEGVDLNVLKALFEKVCPDEIAAIVRSKPTGRYARRIWFLYEWLTSTQLDVPPLTRASYVDALDGGLQFAGRSENSPRHRVRNNLPGTPDFCPLVFRTPWLEEACGIDYGAQIRRCLANVPAEHRPYVWLACANAEAAPRDGPKSPRTVLHQWKRGTMGRPSISLSIEEVAVLKTLTPAELTKRYPELDATLAGIANFSHRTASIFSPPLIAACLQFGFARATGETNPYEHSHRYLAQKVFAHTGYRDADNMVPVSVITLQSKIARYRHLLAHREPAGLFDATEQAEFYLRCLKIAADVAVPKAIPFAAERHEAELNAAAFNNRASASPV